MFRSVMNFAGRRARFSSASIAGRTLQESTYAERVTPPRLHKDSPNIVIVLIDDVGH